MEEKKPRKSFADNMALAADAMNQAADAMNLDFEENLAKIEAVAEKKGIEAGKKIDVMLANAKGKVDQLDTFIQGRLVEFTDLLGGISARVGKIEAEVFKVATSAAAQGMAAESAGSRFEGIEDTVLEIKEYIEFLGRILGNFGSELKSFGVKKSKVIAESIPEEKFEPAGKSLPGKPVSPASLSN